MSLGPLEREWQPFTPCPCGCGVVAGKLSMKTGHAHGCRCPSCRGLRSRRKGQKNQALSHRRLGGQGFTPTNEESARPYTVEVSILPEHKTGEQVPRSFDKFVSTEWFRRALSQAERAIPTGSGALPAVTIRSQFCIIDIRRKPMTDPRTLAEEAPVVLIEVGVPGLADPVVTKDERVTTVQLNWDEPTSPLIARQARQVLEPLRGQHERFDAVLARLDEEGV